VTKQRANPLAFIQRKAANRELGAKDKEEVALQYEEAFLEFCE
jgi:hypothetical protein